MYRSTFTERRENYIYIETKFYFRKNILLLLTLLLCYYFRKDLLDLLGFKSKILEKNKENNKSKDKKLSLQNKSNTNPPSIKETSKERPKETLSEQQPEKPKNKKEKLKDVDKNNYKNNSSDEGFSKKKPLFKFQKNHFLSSSSPDKNRNESTKESKEKPSDNLNKSKGKTLDDVFFKIQNINFFAAFAEKQP